MSKITLSAVVAATSLALATAAMAQTPAPAPMQTAPMNAPKVTEAQLRTNLQAQGYSQIDKIELKGNEYDVMAKKGTQSYKLTVDAATGQVKSATPG